MQRVKYPTSIVKDRSNKFTSKDYFPDVNLLSSLTIDESECINLMCFKVPNLQRPSFNDVMQQAKWEPCNVGDAFGPSWATVWFKLTLSLPVKPHWNGKEVWFVWDAGCEGLIFSKNGDPVSALTGGNGGDKRWVFPLFPSFPNSTLGNEFYIELACNGMFGVATTHNIIGPADPNRFFTLSKCLLQVPRLNAWQLFYDFEIIKGMVDSDELNNTDRGHKAIECLSNVMNTFKGCPPPFKTPYSSPQEIETMEQSIKDCLEITNQFFAGKNGSDVHQVTAIGHCHIDTAWLWPYAETIRKCARSFSTQLFLFDRFPKHKFACSQMQQLEWMRLYYPNLWTRILHAVKQGKFIPVGGTWVEMDCNIPSGESFVRQFLHGQRFSKTHFDKTSRLFWLPDTFGYAAQLPQIWKMCGGEWFFTQKLSWNNINTFPHTTFNWHALDGTSVLTHFSPADTYNAQITTKEVLFTTSNNKDLASTSESLLLFGNGDGGGGPNEHMLKRFERLHDVAGLGAKLEIGDPEEFYARLEKGIKRGVASWQGELYFELHRGTYTSQSHNKLMNRRCEYLLHDVEFLSVIASTLFKGTYNQTEIERMWKLLLLNQFHDVLPGSSIGLVYEDSRKHYAEISTTCSKLIENAMDEIAKGLCVSSCVFNTVGWDRHGVLEVDNMENWFNVVSYGYSTLLKSSLPKHVSPVSLSTVKNGWVLDNGIVKATIDATGKVTSMQHKNRECIQAGKAGNQFLLFEDVPLFWDAWDVEIYHLDQCTPLDGVAKVEKQNEMMCVIEVTVKISARSTIKQRVILKAASPILEFETRVDWDENRKFLKVEFPFDVVSDVASYECAYGIVQRPTHRNTSWDAAKFEVCGHKFADISEYGFGCSLLNDSKFGYSTLGGVMRLSLLRSPKAPDDACDVGQHEIRYAVYPHEGGVENGVVEIGYAFNVPPLLYKPHVTHDETREGSWFRVTGSKNAVLDTIKKAEDSDAIILRMYESLGGQASPTIVTPLPIASAHHVDGLEHELEKLDIESAKDVAQLNLKMRPWKIVTLKADLVPGSPSASDGSWEKV
jgi:alpha-mannosidase